MASLASFTRSAARATSSAYRRLPIRWRLAGGSAALTLVILLGFATIIGVLTQRRIYSDFDNQVSSAADELSQQLKLVYDPVDGTLRCATRVDCLSVKRLDTFAQPQDAVIRIVDLTGNAFQGITTAPVSLGSPDPDGPERVDRYGYRIETRPLAIQGYLYGALYVQYGRKLSDVRETVKRVRLFLVLGVLGGAALALLAGLATARRAMSPIAQLTDVARRIEKTRDPSLTVPKPEADDEVAELADTLEGMLRSLDSARGETEATLSRQREFVADASHELRTPLTAVLANLELLEEELEGEQGETAASALRSTRRMRRLVADLLLLARADAGREAPHRPVDLGETLADAAAELGPVAADHELSVEAEPGCVVSGVRDELHRLALNLMDNAVKHTEPGTAIRATVGREGDAVVLAVEDEGPGVPDDIAARVFERFVRGASDRGGSSGLGLSIVRAVAETHRGTVTLGKGRDDRGARFAVTLPAAVREDVDSAEIVRT